MSESELCFAFRDRELLVVLGHATDRVPDRAELERWALPVRQQEALGAGQWAVDLAEDASAPNGTAFTGLRALFDRLGSPLLRAAGKAIHVLDFLRSARYCQACGSRLERPSEELCKRCPGCGSTVWPRISPAVIMLVRKGDRVLLARGPRSRPGMYSVLAGFVGPGETLEEAVAREIREEVGISVQNLAYFGSQPWPFPDSLMLGFTADHAEGELRVDGAELEDARWFRADELPSLPHPESISRQLIDAWLAESEPAG